MLLALAFYGTLAALAAWATWQDEDLYWVGLTLAVGYVLSNLLYFMAPVTARPGPYTLIEIMVALATYIAWGITGYRALIVLVGVNLASVGVNIAFAMAGEHPSSREVHIFVTVTNICFAVECILALGVGIAHGYRTGRFCRRFRLPWGTAQPNVARESKAPWKG